MTLVRQQVQCLNAEDRGQTARQKLRYDLMRDNLFRPLSGVHGHEWNISREIPGILARQDCLLPHATN